MKEQLISFETAKLAKEKGFDEAMVLHQYVRDEWNQGYTQYCTQSFLQKWLREKHNIQINIFSDLEGGNLEYYVDIFTIDRKNFNCAYSGIKYTYEESLEKGLFEALKLIK